MKAILGLIRPDSGEIKVFGLNSEEGHEEIMRRTGALIESPAIYREMSAYRNMVLASKGRRDKDEIMRLLKWCGFMITETTRQDVFRLE